MKEESVKIEISKNIFDGIEKRIEGTEFNSVEEYVTFVLREVVSETGEEREEGEKEPFTKEDEEKIKERLRGLGYL